MKLTSFFRNLFGLLLLTSSSFAATIIAPADISGNGTSSQIVSSTASDTQVAWVLVVAPVTNSTASCGTATLVGCPRVGDPNVSTTRGVALIPGSSVFLPSTGLGQIYHLRDVYYLIQTGDKLLISWGQ